MKRLISALAIITLLSCGVAKADDRSDKMMPRWAATSTLPKPKSPGYFFMMTDGRGNTLEEARTNSLINLRSKMEDEKHITIDAEAITKAGQEIIDNRSKSMTTKQFVLNSSVTGKPVVLNCKVVDEYWEYKDGKYSVKDLFTVNESENSVGKRGIDDIRLTTSYGAAPVFYSLIPGVGQFVKGSSLKGGLILGGTAVGAAAVILCENQRATYAKKMKEKPQFIDFYRNKKSSWESGRNVAIGATAALYLYNLIDAAVAPGRRRVIVGKRSYEYSLAPVVIDDSFGVGFAMNF